MTVLSLTSPFTTGAEVTAAQKLLNTNKWGDFLDGPIDGVFGEDTAAACRSAKYRLGYPLSAVTGTFGEKLEGHLSGKVPITAAYKARRVARAKADQQTPLRTKALAEAKKSLGIKESPPGSNRVIFATRYGVIGPWCAMAASCWYVDAGSKAAQLGRFWAYTPYMVADARQARNGLVVTHDPQPGDLVLYDWQGDGTADHVGLFEAWEAGSKSRFTAIEANTSLGSDSDGGEVMRRTRSTSDVIEFVRVIK